MGIKVSRIFIGALWVRKEDGGNPKKKNCGKAGMDIFWFQKSTLSRNCTEMLIVPSWLLTHGMDAKVWRFRG